MGYPSSRRLPDKKRYYYSNNPNRRIPAKIPYVRSPYSSTFGTNYPSTNSIATDVSYLSTSNNPSKPSTPVSNTLSHPSPQNKPPNAGISSSNSTPGYANKTTTRTSRYDPNSGSSRPGSMANLQNATLPRNLGSRYNPTYDQGDAYVSSKNHGLVDLPRSRYSGNTSTRYSANVCSPSNGSKGSTHSQSMDSRVTQPGIKTSGLSPAVGRPKSVDNSVIYHKQFHSPTLSDQNDFDIYNSEASNNASFKSGNLFGMANKWQHMEDVGELDVIRSKNSPVSFASAQTVHSTTKSNKNGNQESNNTKGDILDVDVKSDLCIEREPTESNHPPTKDADSAKASGSRNLDKIIVLQDEKVKENESSPPQKSNPHSLGSSLINSVKQTTRESELKVDNEVEGKNKRPDSRRNSSEYIKQQSDGQAKNEESAEAIDNEESAEAIDNKERQNTLGMWTTNSSFSTNGNKSKAGMVRNDSIDIASYEYVYDPQKLRTHINKLSLDRHISGYDVPKEPISICIFPMRKAETLLWGFKNLDRKQVLAHQKYHLKEKITSLREYPFYSRNLTEFNSGLNKVMTKIISQLRSLEWKKSTLLRYKYFESYGIWKKDYSEMEKISSNLRSKELDYISSSAGYKGEDRVDDLGSVGKAKSRRRNRGDFVDDAEIENVMLQIDPDYRHFQAAASIPEMIMDPLKKESMKYYDVNDLVTDKESWATNILVDANMTFSSEEHELFVEAYLAHPKKFGKISLYMGSLRTPEECVLHYYQTKHECDYKSMLLEKNKRRKSGISKKKRKKEKTVDNCAEVSLDHGSGSMNYEVGNLEEGLVVVDNGTHESDVCNKKMITNGTGDADSEVSGDIKYREIDGAPPERYQVLSEVSVEDSSSLGALRAHELALDEQSRPLSSQKQPEMAQLSASMIATLKRETEIANPNLPVLEPNVPFQGKLDNSNSVNYPSQGKRALDKAADSHDISSVKKKFKGAVEHKTSYWSVKESQTFPELLKKYGSQWSMISSILGTKSATMVRNYYQRNASQNGWKSLVEQADLTKDKSVDLDVQKAIFADDIARRTEENRSTTNLSITETTEAVDESSVTENKLRPAFMPNCETDVRKDPFSSAPTLSNTLPPPRLPSIQLGQSTDMAKEDARLHSVSSVAASEPFSPIPRPSNLKSILNNDDVLYGVQPQNRISLPQPHPPAATIFGSSFARKNSVIVQDLQKQSKSRSSSISSLLNPTLQEVPKVGNHSNSESVDGVVGVSASNQIANSRPHSGFLPVNSLVSASNMNSGMATMAAAAVALENGDNSKEEHLRSHPPINLNTSHDSLHTNENTTLLNLSKNASGAQKQAIPNDEINFASDPLAALAAVAAAPEALASLLPDTNK